VITCYRSAHVSFETNSALVAWGNETVYILGMIMEQPGCAQCLSPFAMVKRRGVLILPSSGVCHVRRRLARLR